jgi:hypothetical protein
MVLRGAWRVTVGLAFWALRDHFQANAIYSVFELLAHASEAFSFSASAKPNFAMSCQNLVPNKVAELNMKPK